MYNKENKFLHDLGYVRRSAERRRNDIERNRLFFYGADKDMKNESVAVLDIRSYEISFLIGAKGVNGTFVFRGSRSEKYEGYSASGFLDEDSFRRAVISAVTSVRSNYEGTIRE